MSDTETKIALALLEHPQSNFGTVADAIARGAVPNCPFCGAAGEWLEPWDVARATLDELIESQDEEAGDWYVWRQRRRPGLSSRWRCARCRLVCNEPGFGKARASQWGSTVVRPRETHYATGNGAEAHADAYHRIARRMD